MSELRHGLCAFINTIMSEVLIFFHAFTEQCFAGSILSIQPLMFQKRSGLQKVTIATSNSVIVIAWFKLTRLLHPLSAVMPLFQILLDGAWAG